MQRVTQFMENVVGDIDELLIERSPIASSFVFSQVGDSLTVTPEILTAVYNGQASGAEIFTT